MYRDFFSAYENFNGKCLISLIILVKTLIVDLVRTASAEGLSRKSRFCKLCNTAVENEYHFLFVCTYYDSLRKQFLPDYFVNYPSETSRKHDRAIYTPLEPHFYITKLGYAGVCLFFLFLLQNIDCGYSLEPPRRGGSNVYPQSMF